MTHSLEFIIFVDDSDVQGNWRDLYLERMRKRRFEMSGNQVDIKRNEDHDPNRMNDSQEGFLFYPYRIECMPIKLDKTKEEQIVLAQNMHGVLESIGCRVVMASDFEDEIE